MPLVIVIDRSASSAAISDSKRAFSTATFCKFSRTDGSTPGMTKTSSLRRAPLGEAIQKLLRFLGADADVFPSLLGLALR
jgi:hypothetical protein